MKNLIKSISLVALLTFTALFAGEWHSVNENNSSMSINAIASRQFAFDLQIAVGDNGNVYRSWDAGRYWEFLNAGTGERLTDVTIFFDGSKDIVVAVGDNGTIVRSPDYGDSWEPLDAGSSENLTSVTFDEANQLVWVAGENSAMYYSADYGNSWTALTIENSGLFILDMLWDWDGLFIVGEKNDSSFVHRIQDYQVPPYIQFSFGDTIPNVKLSSLYYNFGQLFAGGSDQAGDSYIYARFYSNGLGPYGLVSSLPQVKLTDMDVYYATDPDTFQIIWVTSDVGQIWESRDGGNTFDVVYKDPFNRPLHAILTDKSSTPNFGQGVAAGFDELILKYSFELLNIIPNQNDNLSYPANRLEMKFTSVPFIPSVNQNVRIKSNYSGDIPFWTDYNSGDSNTVFVNISRAFPIESIPGESWNITVGDSIRQLKDDGLPNSFSSFNYDVNFMPYGSGGMNFEALNFQKLFSKPTTNFVTGFFNYDDILDLATFDGDSLFVFEMDNSGTIGNFRSIPMFVGGIVDPSIKDQLILGDFNNDARQDIIFYDSNSINIFINNNAFDASYDFYLSGNTYNTFNLRDVKLFNANNNAQPDMIILSSDSLVTRVDISEFSFGAQRQILESVSVNNQRMKLADLDVDGWVDLVTANGDGSISHYHGQGNGYFDFADNYLGATAYRDVLIADFDEDKRLELVALMDTDLDLYGVDFNDHTNIISKANDILQQKDPQYIEDVVLHDFGGATSQFSNPAQIDIALVTIDSSLKFFENLNYQDGFFSFSEREDKQLKLDIALNGMIQWDGNADANLDVLAFDRYSGNFQNVFNRNYTPLISNIVTETGGVRLNWNRFDEAQGGFEYYRLHRESWEHGMQEFRSYDFTFIDDTTFLDTEVKPLEHYSYWLEIGFDGQSVSNPNRSDIDMATAVDGPLFGNLSDSTMGYVVNREINVPLGETLTIGPGVQFGFVEGAVFNVYGSLNVKGTLEQMIEFRSYGATDGTYGPWRGIRVHPGTDTVRFEWASLSAADTGIVATNRPLEMRKGGINRSMYGVVSIGDTLTIENLLVDSNMVGISVENSTATLKNITAMFNQQHGISVTQNGSANVSNSIIWNNGLFGINVAPLSSCKISYSTVDLISGLFTPLNVNRLLPPIFISAENDSDFTYQPDPLSPTVDGGDPLDDFNMEPMPNGGRINQGLLGGLKIATKSNRPHLTVSPKQISAAAKIGETDSLAVQIINNGVLDLMISSIEILGNDNIFSLGTQAIAGLMPGQSVQLSVLFSPLLRQLYSDTLAIFSNDPNNPVYKVALSGSGENSLPQILVQPAPAAQVGQLYHFKIDIRDDDNDAVSINVNQKPSWLTQNAAEDFSGTPTTTDIGTDTLAFDLRDAFGGINSYLFTIIVYQDNIIPQFEALPDTTIYTNIPFNFQWKVVDLDGDALIFSDNTSLFAIDPDSGYIAFTPQISDTGISMVTLSAFDGIQAVQDSFKLDIKPSMLNAVQNFALTAQDKAVDVSFTMPENDLYSKTRILWSSSSAITSPNQVTAVLKDTALIAGENIQLRIPGLQINTMYYIAVYNYYISNGVLYSQPLTGSIRTLAPAIALDDIETRLNLPVNQVADSMIIVRNSGGGTLIAKFSYKPDSLTDVWFDMDTIQHVISPYDSLAVNFQMHPNKHLRKDTTYIVQTSLLSNDPTDLARTYTITMQPIFDEFKPVIKVTARPDSIVRQAAFSIHFKGDDILDYPIGDVEDSLYYHYRLIKGISEVIESRDSIKTNSLTFFPLDDGIYTLRLWASDTEGNQKSAAERKSIRFVISATSRNIFRNRWQMLSIPRPVEVAWGSYVRDSLLQIYRWNNQEEQYMPLHSDLNQHYNIGQAVWIITKDGFPVNISGNQADVDSSYSTPLELGWNQIGAPFSYVTGWADMIFITSSGDTMSLPEAAQNELISPVVYWYQHTLEDYNWQDISTAVAVPWRGYWLKAEVAGTLGYSSVAVDTLKDSSVDPLFLAKTMADHTFNISLLTDENGDRNNIFGIAEDKKLKDVQEPPQIGSYSMFYFQGDNKRLTRKISEGFDSVDDVKTWDAVVESRSANRTHTLSWNADKIQASGLYFFMVDLKKEVLVEMNNENSYTFKPAEGSYYFKIYASQDAAYKPKIMPSTFRLVQNYPNPFNPSTTIRFGVPESMQDQKVRISIYNVLGQEVLQLFNRGFEAGYHEVQWNGTNTFGTEVASGVYFYKLISGNNTLARKMILLR